MPDGSVKFFVSGEFAAEFYDEGSSEFDRITLDDNIEVVDRFAEQKVAHETADDVAGYVHCGGLGGNV